jgi:hypothetical protein
MTPLRRCRAFPPGGQRQWPGEAGSTAFPEWTPEFMVDLEF